MALGRGEPCSLGWGVRVNSSEVPEPGTCWSGLWRPSDKESDTGKWQDVGLVLRGLGAGWPRAGHQYCSVQSLTFTEYS